MRRRSWSWFALGRRGLALIWVVLTALAAPVMGHAAAVQPESGGTSLDVGSDGLGTSRLEYAQKAWQESGRRWLAGYTGVRWEGLNRGWMLDERWDGAAGETAQQAYYAEYALRPALELARASRSAQLLDELAGFYTAYRARFLTLGEMRRRGGLWTSTSLLADQGPDETRTLLWVERRVRDYVRECVLCNAQFLHPAARLARVIAGLDSASRTGHMREFLRYYVPLIVDDHLVRLGYRASWRRRDPEGRSRPLVDLWEKALTDDGRDAFQMTDVDLWLIATAAEVLGGHRADPAAVPMSHETRSLLQRMVRVGIELFRSKKSPQADTRDFSGHSVEAASYFNGDMADHPDLAYAAYEGERFPRVTDRRKAPGVSWDTSHFYRVPVFMRALEDNRAGTGVAFPETGDLMGLINQYVYRVFRGDFQRPLFGNFFDGRDGWYRVGYHRSDSGIAPSRHCDMRDSRRQCLSVGAVQGWGLLVKFHRDLGRVHDALVALSTRRDPESIEFRERHYKWLGEAFSVTNGEGERRYPFLLFVLVGEASEARR